MEIEKHIDQAQEIFINGNTFDSERIEFIKNLETCDLLAVPGSGKTTALIAKLYCLAQNMPFEDGSGILVLAHTNHAVNEIENKLKKHCPQLFEYPNFVGTVQSFVNKFLAIPLYTQKNINRCKIIEYDEYKKEFDFHLMHKNGAIAYFKNNNPSIFYNANLNINNVGEIFVCSENKDEEITFKCPQLWHKEKTIDAKTNEVLNFIKSTKIKIFSKGYLNYSDCYFYAKKNIFEHPSIKNILQKRFKYVLIDEMQDLENFQIQIIDDIFFNNEATTVVQRIGDKNQSIYNSVRENCDWITREEKAPQKFTDLKIQNSLRLSPTIGKLVNSFVLQRPKNYEVIGVKKIEGGCIPPHLILLNKNTTGKELQAKFDNLICQFNLHECIKNRNNGFHIISWRTEIENDFSDKIYLKKIFPEFSKESKQKKEDFDCLRKYLFLFDKEKRTFEAIRKSILNALIRILRLEEIYNEFTKRFYRKSDLIEFYKNQGNDFYNDFNLKLFSWCFEIITKENYEEVFKKIKEFIQSDCFIGMNWQNEENHIPKSIVKSNNFINRLYDFNLVSEEKEEHKTSEIEIKLSSIHAVKGQTHCATMYIESAYRTPVYETLKFKTKKPYLFEEHNCKGVYDKQALKMMYVGFSRPTHLLCFAVLEENVKGDLEKFENSGWVVVKDLITSN
jgi:superfamily I DNA/RNA helicase